MKRDWGTYRVSYIPEGWPKKRDNSLSKQLLNEAEKAVREEYDKLVKDGRLPDGQFDSFCAGYGLALLKHSR